MLKKTMLFIGFLIIFPSCAHASLLTSLSQCDKVFFKTVAENRVIPKKMKKSLLPGLAAIVNLTTGKTPVKFNPPLQDNGLTLVSYFNKTFYQVDFGEVLLWGFLVKEPVATILASLPDIQWYVHEAGRLASANHERKKYTDRAWSVDVNKTIVTLPEATFLSRKMFIVEKLSDGETLVYCALQGKYLDRESLSHIRPDLATQ